MCGQVIQSECEMGNSSSAKDRVASSVAGIKGARSVVSGKRSGGHDNLRRHIETASKTGALNLSKSGLTQIPELLLASDLANIRSLDLSGNQLTSLPPSTDMASSLSSLKTFKLATNRLSTFPPDWARLVAARVEILDLSCNAISTLAANLFAPMTSLKEVNLSHNRLTSFPPSLLALPKLNTVNLGHNQIERLDQTDFSAFMATELNLDDNTIYTLTPSLAGAVNLKVVRLSNNRLALDQIYPAILHSSSISNLQLTGNLFDDKQMQSVDGYDSYMERFAAVRRKLD